MTERTWLAQTASQGRGLPHALCHTGDCGTGIKTLQKKSVTVVHSAPGVIAHDDIRHEKGLRPGGFGLVLIRAIADELIYNEQQNEVVFVKYLD